MKVPFETETKRCWTVNQNEKPTINGLRVCAFHRGSLVQIERKDPHT